jgi:hypothetical protein
MTTPPRRDGSWVPLLLGLSLITALLTVIVTLNRLSADGTGAPGTPGPSATAMTPTPTPTPTRSP